MPHNLAVDLPNEIIFMTLLRLRIHEFHNAIGAHWNWYQVAVNSPVLRRRLTHQRKSYCVTLLWY